MSDIPATTKRIVEVIETVKDKLALLVKESDVVDNENTAAKPVNANARNLRSRSTGQAGEKSPQAKLDAINEFSPRLESSMALTYDVHERLRKAHESLKEEKRALTK